MIGAAITRQRQAWARDLLVMAWGRVEKLAAISAVVPDEVRERADQALHDRRGVDAGEHAEYDQVVVQSG